MNHVIRACDLMSLSVVGVFRSISEIRIDSHLGVDTSSAASSHYGSRGGLTWTPPVSGEGSTPTWTEGTPSYTESSSSGEIGNDPPPHPPPPEILCRLSAVNCLTTPATNGVLPVNSTA